MKPTMIVFGIGMVILAGFAAFLAHSVLGTAESREEELQTEYELHADALRALGTQPVAFAPPRLAPYLEVRQEVATYFKRRHSQDDSPSSFHGLETRNNMLQLLAGALAKRKLTLGEYLSISRVWQSALHRPELRELRDGWVARVTTKDHPDGLPLPKAAEPKPDQLKAIVSAKAILLDTLEADLLGPTLDAIVAR